MPVITLAQAEAQLALWLAADAAVATGQSYGHGQSSLTRADAGKITEKIEYWEKKVSQLSNGRVAGDSRDLAQTRKTERQSRKLKEELEDDELLA